MVPHTLFREIWISQCVHRLTSQLVGSDIAVAPRSPRHIPVDIFLITSITEDMQKAGARHEASREASREEAGVDAAARAGQAASRQDSGRQEARGGEAAAVSYIYVQWTIRQGLGV